MPPHCVRASGVAIAGARIAFEIGLSLVGGTTQFIITYPPGAAGNSAPSACYVMLTTAVTAFAARHCQKS
jgi:hypothetical protein